jgi:hypothetical protein
MALRVVPHFITPGIIAAQVGVSLHRVLYVLATRPHIKPVAKAGTLRLFDSEAVAMVRHELHTIDARRHGRGQGGAL